MANPGKVGAVELEHEPSAVDLVVLDLHRVGKGKEIRLVAGVVLVLEVRRDDAGRSRAHERICHVDVCKGGLQVGNVGPHRIPVTVGEGTDAGRQRVATAASFAREILRELLTGGIGNARPALATEAI
jgi:hypothetical protein